MFLIHLLSSIKAPTFLVAGLTTWAFSLVAMAEETWAQFGAAGLAIGGLGYLLKVILDFLLKWKEVKRSEGPTPDVVHQHVGDNRMDKLGTLIDQTGLRLEASMALNEKLGVIMTDVQVIKQKVESIVNLGDERHQNVLKMTDKLFQEVGELLKRPSCQQCSNFNPSDSTIK